MTLAWTGVTGNDWWTAGNWTSDSPVWLKGASAATTHYVPQAYWSSVTITGTAASPVNVDYDAAEGKSEAGTTVGPLTVGPYATLSISGQTSASVAFSVSTLDVAQGGTVVIDTTDPVNLGSDPTVDGTLEIIGSTADISSHSVSGSGALILDGATLGSTTAYFQLGSNLTTSLRNRATLFVNNANAGKKISLDGTANTIALEGYNQTVSAALIGFNTETVIRITDLRAPVSATLTANGDGTYKLFIAFDQWRNGITFSDVTLASGADPANGFVLSSDPHGGWDVVMGPPAETNAEAACFLAGVLIRTPRGEWPVEDIRIGDHVLARDPRSGEEVVRPVVWVGSRRVHIADGAPDDKAHRPVRLLKDAIAEGVPHKDLLVTPEHCLFLDGRFVPARMLVNGRSIFYDRTIRAYTYYHLETEEHSVIWADGMPCESYLDTGNRASFTQHGNMAVLRRVPRSWSENAAAPLATDRATVEPLHRRTERRAILMGLALRSAPPVLTGEADLRLVTDTGETIRKTREASGRAIFLLPPGTASVRLVSRASRPADVLGPFHDDRRSLGVLVGAVDLFGGEDATRVEAHLTQTGLPGWQGLEEGGRRWTNGDALLPLGAPDHGARLLAVQILAGGPYLAPDERAEIAAAS